MNMAEEEQQITEQQLNEWKKQLVPDRDGLYSVFLPMQKHLRTQSDVKNAFVQFGEIKLIRQASSNYFIKYLTRDAALAAISKLHRQYQANPGVHKVLPPSDTRQAASSGGSMERKRVEKDRLEEDNRGLYTICVRKKDENAQTLTDIKEIFQKYGQICCPSETISNAYIRYGSRKSAEDAIENEWKTHCIHVPEIYYKYRKRVGQKASPGSPLATSSTNNSSNDIKDVPKPAARTTNGSAVSRSAHSLSPPDAFSDPPPPSRKAERAPARVCARGGSEAGVGATLDLIRACVQEQMQLHTEGSSNQHLSSTVSSVDFTDISFSDVFPIRYTFIGEEGDIARDTSAEEAVRVMLKPVEEAALRTLRLQAQMRFPRAQTFLAEYDMNLSCCLSGAAAGGGVGSNLASLKQLQAFVQKKTEQLSEQPALLRVIYGMNRAALKLLHASPSQPDSNNSPDAAFTANLWRQWLQALNMVVVESGSTCCLRHTSLSQTGEMRTHAGLPSFALYSGVPSDASKAAPADIMQTLMDLEREPALIIDLFSPLPSTTTTTSSSSCSSQDLDTPCPVMFTDFLELPSPALHPPAAFTSANVWRGELVSHVHHLLAVLQSKYSRSGGGGDSNGRGNKYEAFGLMVLHKQDVYVTRLAAPAQYLVALTEQRPQNRTFYTPAAPYAALSISRWKLNFALADHRQALAEFIAMLL